MVQIVDSPLFPFVATFLFVFAIVFALLIKAKIFESRKANGAIAVSIGLFASAFPPLVEALQEIMPIAAMILVVLFFLMLVRELIGGKEGSDDTLPLIIVFAIVLLILAAFQDRIPNAFGIGSETIAGLAGIILIFLIFWFVYNRKVAEPT